MDDEEEAMMAKIRMKTTQKHPGNASLVVLGGKREKMNPTPEMLVPQMNFHLDVWAWRTPKIMAMTIIP